MVFMAFSCIAAQSVCIRAERKTNVLYNSLGLPTHEEYTDGYTKISNGDTQAFAMSIFIHHIAVSIRVVRKNQGEAPSLTVLRICRQIETPCIYFFDYVR